MFSVSVNLREEKRAGYPLRDAALCGFIARAASLPVYQKMLHCAAFIHGIFSAALSVLERVEIERNALAFRTCLDAERLTFDRDAAAIAVEAIRTNNAPEGSEGYVNMLKTYTTPTVLKFAEAAGIRRNAQDKWEDLILFPIDECHTLNPDIYTQNDIKDENRSTYHALCSVLRDLIETPIFALFMSTTSKTRQLAPPVLVDPSSRVTGGELVQHPPYTAFPFDVYKAIIVENTRNLDEVCELSFLCRFGRPLWWTRWHSGDEDVRKGLIKFAMAKLKGNAGMLSDAAKFAALSTRHLLMFEPDRRPPGMDNKQYQAATVEEYRQVASHMRTVHCIPTHREYMHTSTPSEPILAEAAARLLALSECPQVKILAEDLNPLVGKGERGELAARLLCNLAHDAALKISPIILDENLEFSRPIRLIHFLEALIAPKSHSQLLDSRPVTGGNLPFRDAFDDCWVNFTHWSKMGDASCLTTAALWKAIARGTAWQCCDGMPGIDQLIPFVRGRHAKLGRGTVSAIAIQNKDRKTALKVKLDDKFPARLFADAPGGTRQSFIFLTMQLGVQLSAAAAAKATKAAPAITPSKTSVGVSPRIRTTRSVEVDNRPGRYDITINGCSPTVYQVIREEDRSHWAQLLAARSLESELARQTPPHMELLVRSKPLFWSGAPSFDWAEDADGKVDVNEEQEEKIEFGKGEEEEDDI
ncbi:hypothetical protein B0H34DRAFT_705708 [Crassisporium funariophilum]|nr:hypothetical protein B0H34DRAFT_705708 [Crassisporium funariophilum]